MNSFLKVFYNSSFVRQIYHSTAGHFLYHIIMDIADIIRGRKDPLVPPRYKTFTGRGDFRAIGRAHTEMFKQLCALQPDEVILEVGSGMGRMAVGLTEYLSAKGQYYGFDIVSSAVTWCTSHISKRYPNFHFIHADIYNKMYNKKGKTQPTEFIFPFEKQTFDFVFLTSVFTHMKPLEITHYLNEISRVLKKNGRGFATANLINDFSLAQVQKKATSLDFKYKFENYRSISLTTPEFNIALEEQWVRGAFARANLEIIEPIKYGQWSGKNDIEHFQDVILFRKS